MNTDRIEVDIKVPNQTRYLCLIGHIGENIALALKHYGGDREKLAYELNLVLTEGKTSRLYQRLVEREQSVTFVSADYGESKDPTLFHIRAEARGEHTAAEIENTIYDELKRIAAEGAHRQELDRAKHQVKAHFVLSRERALDQAMLLGQTESLHGPGYVETYIERISAITSE